MIDMNESFHVLDIRSLRNLFPVTGGESFADSLFITDTHYTEDFNFMTEPVRFNGYLAFFCQGGEFTVEVNLKRIKVRDNSLVICVPGAICRVTEVNAETLKDVRIVIIAASTELMSSIRFDFNSLFNESVAALDNPSIILDGRNLEVCQKYFDLMKTLFENELPGSKDAIRFLFSSIFYMLGAIWTGQLQEAREHNVPPGGRSQAIFDSFLKLVAEYHCSERNVSFYADRLCLTPKYLSKLIKTISDRSAPEWIDSFVILEAKNMLKYSDMPIKEIVYHLNFPNQSVFYKFFKSHTGMTPSEYRGGKDKSF